MGDLADWLLTEADVNAALGAEVRAAREAAGLSRPELAARLPFPIAVATLLNWELGHRAISYVKLLEIARTLRRSGPELLGRALDRVESIHSLTVALDLQRLSQNVRFKVLRTWADNKLRTGQVEGTVARVHHSVVREWAVMLDVPLPDLVRYLEQAASLTQ